MSKILISLPVTDLARSVAFYEALGFAKSPDFSGDHGAFLIWTDAIRVMIMTREVWRTMTTRPIPPSDQSEVGFQLSVDDRATVDAIATAAGAAGGTLDINPVEDHGFMYTRDLADPDGHIWGITWMDETAMAAAATE